MKNGWPVRVSMKTTTLASIHHPLALKSKSVMLAQQNKKSLKDQVSGKSNVNSFSAIILKSLLRA